MDRKIVFDWRYFRRFFGLALTTGATQAVTNPKPLIAGWNAMHGIEVAYFVIALLCIGVAVSGCNYLWCLGLLKLEGYRSRKGWAHLSGETPRDRWRRRGRWLALRLKGCA